MGLGIFLYGMHLLENGLQTLGSDKIRYWLGKTTQNSLGSVATGTFITAILQSSSMVSLIVLAFASSGMIQLFNAVGVILGANLGTTFTGWVVATIGFKMDLEAFGLPCFGIGGLIYVFTKSGRKLNSTAMISMGFGLLIFGLSVMKDSVSDLPQILSPELLGQLTLPSFLLVGMLMTAVIQSSSAMTLIALTALNTGIIDLSSAAALVVGADIGTTSTTALGSLKSAPVGKQLALAHVIYNLVVDAIAFLVMIPFLPDLLNVFGITDPLYGLVLFHSSFNLLGLLIFVPVLKPYSRWLSGFFVDQTKPTSRFLHATSYKIPEAAVIALQKELVELFTKVVSINIRNFKFDSNQMVLSESSSHRLQESFSTESDFEARYKETKRLEGEMFRYGGNLVSSANNDEVSARVDLIRDAARDAVYAMKTLKDVRGDLVEFRRMLHRIESEPAYEKRLAHLYEVLADLLFVAHKAGYREQKLIWLRSQNERIHSELHEQIMHQIRDEKLDADGVATILNTNREIWHSNRNLFDAFEHLIELG